MSWLQGRGEVWGWIGNQALVETLLLGKTNVHAKLQMSLFSNERHRSSPVFRSVL